MLIKRITLRNFRSYEKEEVNFPEGTLLLAGDIGSGKTSLLLAIEFALFGILKGLVNPNSLLRHGKKQGWVELEFALYTPTKNSQQDQIQTVIIKRGLKRLKQRVVQTEGSITINNQQRTLSPTELKYEIISLLGYPKELTSKSKEMIHRYTIYTPQEEMKKILFEKTEDRVNTLRRIFNIDKYSRIRENTALLAKQFRDRINMLQTRTEDLGDLKKQKDKFQSETDGLRQELEELGKKINLAQTTLSQTEQKKQGLEQQIEKNQQKEKTLISLTNSIQEKTEIKVRHNQAISYLMEDITSFQEKINFLLQEIREKDAQKLTQQIEANQKEINEFENQKQQLQKNIQEYKKRIRQSQEEINHLSSVKKDLAQLKNKAAQLLEEQKKSSQERIKPQLQTRQKEQQELLKQIAQKESQISNSQGIIKKLQGLKDPHCPLCQQKVDQDHCQNIIFLEQDKIKQSHHRLNQLRQKQDQVLSAINNLEKQLSQVLNQEKELARSQERIKSLEKEKQRIQQLDSQQQDQQKELQQLETELKEMRGKNLDEERARIDKLKSDLKKIEEEKRLCLMIDSKTAEKKRLVLETEALSEKIRSLRQQKEVLDEELKGFHQLKEKNNQLKKEIEESQQNLKQLEIRQAEKKNRLQMRKEEIQKLQEKIQKKIQYKKQAQKLAQQETWLTTKFSGLMVFIEKAVMTKINQEFDLLFQKWFKLLIEDDTLSVSIDEEFTPIISQNNHTTKIDFLSGGEKTSCALAYRLALNRVINDLVGEIKTKDLIILDEPTDGFSAEQLDKVREVLNQLGTRQTIIVSHEQKIESFVDHVIRISKNQSRSEINTLI